MSAWKIKSLLGLYNTLHVLVLCEGSEIHHHGGLYSMKSLLTKLHADPQHGNHSHLIASLLEMDTSRG